MRGGRELGGRGGSRGLFGVAQRETVDGWTVAQEYCHVRSITPRARATSLRPLAAMHACVYAYVYVHGATA